MFESKRDFRKLRKKCFHALQQFDTHLVALTSSDPGYISVINPASQSIYSYLTDYVRQFSEQRFGKQIQEIKILDWGCGKGQVSYFLKKRGADVVSCDVEKNSVDSALGVQATPIITDSKIEVVPLKHESQIPFEDKSFDVVLSFGVLEHVPRDQESLNEIHRILKPGGLFFCFFLPYTFSWTQRLAHSRGDFYHDRLYGKAQVKGMLQLASLKTLDIWHRQLLPKNSVKYPNPHIAERVDQFLSEWTPLRYFATNIEFVAVREN